ncbi:MAG: cell division protein ZapA [Pseudomonadota bacterium]
MSSSKEAVTVNVLDREYRIACDPGERRQLLDAADYLDQQMRSIRDGANIVGMEKIAVLAGLNITNMFLQVQQREETMSGNVAERLKSLRDRLESEELT